MCVEDVGVGVGGRVISVTVQTLGWTVVSVTAVLDIVVAVLVTNVVVAGALSIV